MAAERPPLGTRLKYNLLGVTPPIRYREWVERDIASRTWPLRQAAIAALALALGGGVGSLIAGQPFPLWAWLIGGVGGAVIAWLVLDQRARHLRRHERRWARREAQGENGITGPASPG